MAPKKGENQKLQIPLFNIAEHDELGTTDDIHILINWSDDLKSSRPNRRRIRH